MITPVSPRLVPALAPPRSDDLSRSGAAVPGRGRALPVVEVCTRSHPDLVCAVTVMDARGRLAATAVVHALGWRPGSACSDLLGVSLGMVTLGEFGRPVGQFGVAAYSSSSWARWRRAVRYSANTPPSLITMPEQS